MDIIDRRSNPHGKNIENRRRVIERARDAVQKSVREAIAHGSIQETGHDRSVTVPADALHEPSFHRVFSGGSRHFILTGNKEFCRGDKLQRPPAGGQGGNGGGEGSPSESGEGEDSFRFVLSREEFLDLFLDDLELPDLIKRELSTTETTAPMRAGLSNEGSPSQLDLSRTMRRSIARRIGLRRPRPDDMVRLEQRIAALEEQRPLGVGELEELQLLREQRATMQRRLARIPWVDPVDLRYRRHAVVPQPVTRAVMFCLMDVSGSMTERMKDLAKQFFALLHVFLERRYRTLDIVFIRHAERAEEVDENTFFHDPSTGGTLVSSALELMAEIQKRRYPVHSWNIYAAQVSDGDNLPSDMARACTLLSDEILPNVQYFAYIEVSASGAVIRGQTDLWRAYHDISTHVPHLAVRRVAERKDIFPVFRDLFSQQPEREHA
ncbi:hypothetical protein CFR73_03325 [Novacetimonas maltaceti]|uniref:UPF0229 protein KMAL_00610 n=1 Tax=Novacetimonas maltaceti TaxID=1203393 RepID=A0A2S3W5T4_9PROT|nr:YeaH/YhbH family protein [Novacetimonas maltaceti]POF64168.1 hypothetical protein KMAL_00610 [Novacetimonas maltaceti]PYD61556.1 hypothetical protein CFR73_03325 [Novacetimonas maltaceti]